MPYKLFDKDDKEIVHHNLQDKLIWCRSGEKIEESFVRIHGDQLKVIVNPAKKTDPYVPDLKDAETTQLGDLKTQNTPFFTSRRYGIDPTYAVVFNLKDQKRYAQQYPDIDIYYWVDWIVMKFASDTTEIKVEPLTGVWKIPFRDLSILCDASPLHSYMQRRNDTAGNAKSSYVLDIRDPLFRRVV